jgi:hypothetical protein
MHPMTVGAMDAIWREHVFVWAIFKGGLATPEQSPVQLGSPKTTMSTRYHGTLLDHLADFMIYLSSASVFVVIVVGMVIVVDVIVPIAVVVLAFVLRRPLVLLSRRLVVACCFAFVAGIFAAHPSFGWLLCLPCIAVVEWQMKMPRIAEVAQRKTATPIAKVARQTASSRILVGWG